MMPFLPLVKADQASRTIWARAAVEEPDKSREIMDYASAVPQFQKWSDGFKAATLGKSLGNIRAMHNPRHLAGKVTEIVYDDAAKAVDICLKVIDPVDWAKVEEGGYTGLSIGGGYLKKWTDGDLTRYTPRIAEISLVDSPCIPSALLKLEMQKQDGSVEEILLKGIPRTFAQLVPPASFNARMQKGILGRLNEFTETMAAHPSVMRMAAHPGVKLADKAVKATKTLRETAAAAGGVAGLATGAYAAMANPAPAKKKPALQMPGYMQKSLSAGVGRVGKKLLDVQMNLTRHSVSAGGAVGERIGQKLGGASSGRKGKLIGEGIGAGLSTVPVNVGTVALGLGINRLRRKKPAAEMQMPAHMQKAASAAERDKIAATMHEFKAGKLRAYRGVNPRSGKPRRGPKVADQRQAIAIALSQAQRLGKQQTAIGAELAKRDNDNRNPRSKLRAKLAEHASTGAAIGGVVGGLGGGVPGVAVGSVAGTAIGAATGAISHAIAARQHDKGQAEQTQAHAALSDKQHAQRIAAAKARWVKEGHADYDGHFDKMKATAAKSALGRDAKVASVERQRGNFWHGVADTQAAYDKVRKHLPKDANLMMEVHHAGGLLYNPEGVGEHHFNAESGTHKPLYMLHPAEADDFVAKHGKAGAQVAKAAPLGLISHRDQLVPSDSALDFTSNRELEAAA